VRRLVEKDAAQGDVDRDVDRADERHVDRAVGDLRRGAGQVDGHGSTVDRHGDLDQLVALGRIGVVGESVDVALGGVRPVR